VRERSALIRTPPPRRRRASEIRNDEDSALGRRDAAADVGETAAAVADENTEKSAEK
jgi:hypothetical protein